MAPALSPSAPSRAPDAVPGLPTDPDPGPPDGASGDDALGDDLLGVVARLQRWATRHADLPVPTAQLRLLALLEDLGQARIGDLGRADHCSQPTMSAQVQRLEALGWVERIVDGSDARASLLMLSHAGHQILTSGRRARTLAVAPLLASLSPAERRAVARAVHILDAALTTAAPPTSRPDR